MLSAQIDTDLKIAQKEKNDVAVSALRNLKAALKNAEIQNQQPLTDDDVLGVVAKKVKQHKDSIESFKAGNRSDLVDHELAQMAILQKYLPAQASEEELAAVVKQVITDLKATASDFGKVMSSVMSKVKGRADGSVITKLVKENLK